MVSCETINWNQYDLQMPYSQSITCQETIRENKIHNLPLNLIVKGDLIKLKPGHTINLYCKNIASNECFERGKVFEHEEINTERKSSHVDELFFGSVTETDHNSFFNTYIESCDLKKVPKTIVCQALETPYLTHLK